MIESINQAGGGGGGGLESVVAGTGISVDNTNPDNPIITNTSLNTDETAKVSSNDTTAGYLNGKLVAGTGISFTEGNDGGNETLSIVNSAAGDTTYTVTTADCENTSLKVRMIDVTIPANTWEDGERITIEVFRQMSNQSGSTFSSDSWIGGTGLLENAGNNQNVTTGTITSAMHRFDFIRAGTTVYASRVWANHNFPFYYNSGFNLMSGSSSFALPQSTGVNFATSITLYIDHKWSSANATVYQRVLWAKCYKSSAGQQ
jgi:hypothetical protein